ncbi:hypothetical protein P7K49_006909 [Saguinus oedipus]|uniref:Uncharacterized protein n=1 Tax=Saguinus oedipus TaxID=9490 RepID=A0ABQ9W3R4_SAGOE|nr:hypothetical protein P7K49_006909 [Saguinus oedipus]
MVHLLSIVSLLKGALGKGLHKEFWENGVGRDQALEGDQQNPPRSGGKVQRVLSPVQLLNPEKALLLAFAANQKEPMNLNFKVKEEPKEGESLSATLPRPSYVFSPESEVSAPGASEDTLKPQEGKGNVLRRDVSVKAASELLMKLSGT